MTRCVILAKLATRTRVCAMLLAMLGVIYPLSAQASSKSLPTYFRYEVLKPGALKNLLAGDFNGDGHVDIVGLTPSQRSLVLMSAKGSFTFRAHRLFKLPSRAQTVFAVNVLGDTHAELVMHMASPASAQVWQVLGRGGDLKPRKHSELLLPTDVERLYFSPKRTQDKRFFLARTAVGKLLSFSFRAKEGFSNLDTLTLSHRVSEIILPARSSTDFFTQAVGENALWLHRPPPNMPLAIRCKESVSLAATDDFNSNEVLDLVVVQATPNGKTTVEVIFDVGVETGVTPIRFETPLNPKQIFIRDFNADGLLDIGLCNEGSFALHIAQSPTDFSESVIIAFSDVASAITVADLNQNGKPEIIVSEEKTGKLVVYSTAHYEQLGVERLATSGKPKHLAFLAARKHLLVSCNQPHYLEQYHYFDRQLLRTGGLSVSGNIVSLWHDETQVVLLTSSPVTLIRQSYKSQMAVTHSLFSLGVTSSAFWKSTDKHPALVAILEEKHAGTVPQVLFYMLNSDSALSISEMFLDTPMSAENIISICSATFKKHHYLIALKSEKNVQAIVVYELKIEGTRLRLVEVERHVLPVEFAIQGAKHLFARVDKHESVDFLVAGHNRAVILLSERLYQPQQISNFPKLNDGDIVVWTDVDGNEHDDLLVSRQRNTEVLFLRGRLKGEFDPPKVILGDAIATGITSVVTKQHATLFVANAKLHTVDILRLKK